MSQETSLNRALQEASELRSALLAVTLSTPVVTEASSTMSAQLSDSAQQHIAQVNQAHTKNVGDLEQAVEDFIRMATTLIAELENPKS